MRRLALGVVFSGMALGSYAGELLSSVDAIKQAVTAVDSRGAVVDGGVHNLRVVVDASQCQIHRGGPGESGDAVTTDVTFLSTQPKSLMFRGGDLYFIDGYFGKPLDAPNSSQVRYHHATFHLKQGDNLLEVVYREVDPTHAARPRVFTAECALGTGARFYAID